MNITDLTVKTYEIHADIAASGVNMDQWHDAISLVPPQMRARDVAEFIYANRDELPESCREGGADVIDYLIETAFAGYGDGRGLAMQKVLRGQKVKGAPEADGRYAPVAESPDVAA